MFSIELEWKKEILSGSGTEESPYLYGDTYGVCLELVDTYFKANAGVQYRGMTTSNTLLVHFSEEPTQEIKDLIQTYWSLLDQASPEAVAYCPEVDKRAAVEALRPGIAAKTWDTMSVAERKIVLNQMPTKAELGL